MFTKGMLTIGLIHTSLALLLPTPAAKVVRDMCKNMSFTPCVVLVIDDNPYGLTVALRINLRSSP
jgi:hypothetical protein